MPETETEEQRVPILSRLRPPAGAVRPRRRVGRGPASGLGKTCGKGQKGQKSRGPLKKLHFEGGQMPLQRRIPKVGFNNLFGTHYAVVNLTALDAFEADSVVDEAALRQKRLVRGRADGVKILGVGELQKALTLKVHAISKSARAKVEQAGGSVELITPKPKGPSPKG